MTLKPFFVFSGHKTLKMSEHPTSPSARLTDTEPETPSSRVGVSTLFSIAAKLLYNLIILFFVFNGWGAKIEINWMLLGDWIWGLHYFFHSFWVKTRGWGVNKILFRRGIKINLVQNILLRLTYNLSGTAGWTTRHWHGHFAARGRRRRPARLRGRGAWRTRPWRRGWGRGGGRELVWRWYAEWLQRDATFRQVGVWCLPGI